ncbi:MAG TPA: hypothetical protein VMG08_07025 [Allosphingosinicella sp.]|nr:hypothetical protein [Allosphingosinicella sp.]
MHAPVKDQSSTTDRPGLRALFVRYPFRAGSLIFGGIVVIYALGAKGLRRVLFMDRNNVIVPASDVHPSGDDTGPGADRKLAGAKPPAKALPPGSYSRESLPPPRPEVQAILDRVKKSARDEGADGLSKSGKAPTKALRSKRRIASGGPAKRRLDMA